MPASARGSIDEDRPVIPTDQPHTSEIEEAYTEPGNVRVRTSTSGYSETTSDVADQKPSAWRVDIHALAVSYKIKRLKQQQIVLEKLAAAAEGGKEATMSNEASGSSSRQQPRSYQLMISFVSKHVKRYQSLEDKIDDLCKRMVMISAHIMQSVCFCFPGSYVCTTKFFSDSKNIFVLLKHNKQNVLMGTGGEQKERGAGEGGRQGAECRARAVPGGNVPAAALHGGHGAEAAGDAVQGRHEPRALL